MNVLIVDDERIIRNGIRAAVPWNTLGIATVSMAASGKEALVAAKEHRPDIVITDIQMAGMTGLELIAEIRALYGDIRIVVLTGYDEFDYARECLRMQVQEFLLKPVDEKILIDTMKRQVQSIANDRKKEAEQIHMRRISGTREQMALESWMRKLIRREEPGHTVKRICETYHLEPGCRIQMAILLPSVRTYETHRGDGESLSLLTIKNLLIGYLDAGHRGISFEDPQGRIAAGLFAGEKIDEIENNIQTFTRLIQEECGIKLRVVTGSVVEGFANLYLSYNEAEYLLQKEREQFHPSKRPVGTVGQLDMFREVYTEFISKLNESIGDTAMVLRIFESFCVATNSYNITDQYVTKCCFEIASNVYFTYTVESGGSTDSQLNTLLTALLSGSREEKYGVTRTFLENLLNTEEDEARELVGKVKHYIDEHLTEDISVAGIAAYFFLSPNYFSRLFKRVAQEGCNEYIVRKRIKHAEYLLATTNMKIQRIAQEAGYRDTNYFSLAFKKQMGVSPLQYREQLRLKG